MKRTAAALFYLNGYTVDDCFTFGVGVAKLQGLIENALLHYNRTWGYGRANQ